MENVSPGFPRDFPAGKEFVTSHMEMFSHFARETVTT